MFNKKQTTESDAKQQEMFKMLIDIFTPEATITDVNSQTGNKKNQQTMKDLYTVVSKPTRQECVVKEGRSVILEIYQDDDYSVSTRGMYLKHLDLSDDLINKIKASLVYNPKYDMKHSFVLKTDDMVKVLSSYKNRKNNIDNGLVKPGEIENSAKY